MWNVHQNAICPRAQCFCQFQQSRFCYFWAAWKQVWVFTMVNLKLKMSMFGVGTTKIFNPSAFGLHGTNCSSCVLPENEIICSSIETGSARGRSRQPYIMKETRGLISKSMSPFFSSSVISSSLTSWSQVHSLKCRFLVMLPATRGTVAFFFQ